jgi:hypothetical protein
VYLLSRQRKYGANPYSRPNIVSYTTVLSHSPFLSKIQELIDGVESAANMGKRGRF